MLAPSAGPFVQAVHAGGVVWAPCPVIWALPAWPGHEAL